MQTELVSPPRSRPGFFQLRDRGSSVRTEIVAGVATFLAAAYAAVVVPGELAGAGIPHGPITTAVICAIVLATVAMGLVTNLPFVIAPGLGGVALVAVTIVGQDKVPWPTALGMVFWSGVVFLALSVFGVREFIVRLIPANIKRAISAGVGLFIALVGFRNGDLIVANSESKALSVGDLGSPGPLLALGALAVLIALMARRIPGAFIIVIVAATLIGIPLGVTHVPAQLFTAPPSPGPVVFHVDVLGALRAQYFPYIFAFFVSEFFSMTGTLLAVSGRAGLLDADGNVPNAKRAFIVDSASVVGGSALGAPSMAAYLESTAGAESGGKTGITALVTAGCFALLIPLGFLAAVIPSAATAPVLIYIGLSMLSSLKSVETADPTEFIPVALTVSTTVFFGNFGTGIAVGLASYVLAKALAGRFRQIPVGLWFVMIPLGYYFYTLAT